MKWNKYRLKTTTQATDFVCGLLIELGINGMEVEDNVQLSEEEKKMQFIDYLADLPEDDGTAYIQVSDTEFQVKEGTRRVTTYYPTGGEPEYDYDTEVNVEGDPYDRPSLTVYDEYGNSFWIYEGSDGYWHEDDGTAYIQLSDSEFQAKEGTRIVTTYY